MTLIVIIDAANKLVVIMTNANFHFCPSNKRGIEGNLLFRIEHNGEHADIPTLYRLFPHEWNPKSERVKLSKDDYNRNHYLINLMEKMAWDKERLRSLLSKSSRKGEYDVTEIVKLFRKEPGKGTLIHFCEKVCKTLKKNDRQRTARAYSSAVTSLHKFTEGNIVMLNGITASLMRSYQDYLLSEGLAMNTISFYVRNLRALYYRAIDAKLIRAQEDNPFADVFTGIYETRKRALSEEEINSLAAVENDVEKKIREIERDSDVADAAATKLLKHYRGMKTALSYFLFCFHARGMSFIDMAFLRKIDIKEDDRILYIRKKTGKYLEVKITEPMRKIIDHFREQCNTSEYVFPLGYTD